MTVALGTLGECTLLFLFDVLFDVASELFFLLALGVVSCGATRGEEPADVVPQPRREFRAAWIATVANIDWPSKPGLPAREQKAELVELLDIAQRIHLNAVILQVRPACDALYESALEPWSEFLTGEMGKAPDEPYDPLAFAIDEAHARGLELHAWINPYRALHPASKGSVSRNHVSKSQPDIVKSYGKYLWLDPGEPAAIEHTMAVVRDLVERYDLDGLHIDDYFYPYPIDGDGGKVPFPDDPSWEGYLEKVSNTNAEPLSRDDWRRQNVDKLVEQIYAEIKATKPWVKFGVSPFGIWRPGYPEQVKGFDQYAAIYADARKWWHEGWLDYFVPQLYWKIGKSAQSYPALLNWWDGENKLQRHLWPGNYTSRLLAEGKGRWEAEELLAQIWVTRAQAGATGNVHFSMKALARNTDGIADKLLAGPYREPALVPASDWLAGDEPIPGNVEVNWAPSQGNTLPRDKAVAKLSLEGGAQPWLWAVRLQAGDTWHTAILPGSEDEYEVERSGEENRIHVSAVDRFGREGPITKFDVP